MKTQGISNVTIFALLTLFLSLNQCSEDTVADAACSSNKFPADGAVVSVGATIQLSWAALPGVKVYDVYVGSGTSPAELMASNVHGASASFAVPADLDVTYSWYVQPRNWRGKATECSANATTFKAVNNFDVDDQQIVVDVLVVNFDPDNKLTAETKKLHEFYYWNDPRTLAEEYTADIFEASGGLLKYNIVDWRDVNQYPAKADGFVYDDLSYHTCFTSADHSQCHSPDDLDYDKVIADHDIIQGIDNDVYDEVWIFGGPYFGYWESSMAGPGAFYINGGVFPHVRSKRAFAIMGFNYERGVAEMIHNLCHRTEATMSKVYGGWAAEKLTTSWAKFAANKTQSGEAAVGSCHYPPNAKEDYDYANQQFVDSSADDWFNYPLLSGEKKSINAEAWGGPDYQRNYLRWWFHHLPRKEGVGPDGKLNNWWRYLFEFNENVN
jgi:hypothetical protein